MAGSPPPIMTTDHKNKKKHSILSLPHQDVVCCKPDPLRLSTGWSAALNICLVYLTVAMLFGFVFVYTLPRIETQIYNVSITSEDYQATLRLEMEPPLKPARVNMLCQLPDQRNVSILYEVEERQVIYKAKSQPWCYIRTTTGAQFQEETALFKSLISGKNAFNLEDLKPDEIHLFKHSYPMTRQQRHQHLSATVRQFCKEHQIFWLMHFDVNQGLDDLPPKPSRAKHRRQLINNVHHVDACFQTLVIYENGY